MKKKKKLYLIASVILIMMIICSICLMSCKGDDMELYVNNISEARYNYYYAEANGYKVSFTAGVRESDFKLDGYHTDNIEFGVITVILPSDVNYSGFATYRLEYDNKLASGTLEKNPFDGSFMADVGFVIDNAKIVLSIKMGDTSMKFDMRDMSSNFNMDYMGAFELFVANIDINEFMVDKEFQAEVYIKIMHDDTIDSGYYYLIRVIGRDGKVISGMVNPISGELMAVTSSRL